MYPFTTAEKWNRSELTDYTPQIRIALSPLIFEILGCKDMEIRILEFVASDYFPFAMQRSAHI